MLVHIPSLRKVKTSFQRWCLKRTAHPILPMGTYSEPGGWGDYRPPRPAVVEHLSIEASDESSGIPQELNPSGPVVANGAEDAPVRKKLLQEHQIEIGAGLGPLAGKIWRIGVMGHTARVENIERFAKALAAVL